MGGFYDGRIDVWRRILGPEMHYHHALFDAGEIDAPEAAMLTASRHAVNSLYPFIPRGSRVYDIGCGWGGPLGMWVADLGCPALGLTVSHRQFTYVASLGYAVRWGDAECTYPPGRFDCVVLLESLEHMRDKPAVLSTLRVYADRLVMRVNCQDQAPPATAFAGSMHMISSRHLRQALDEAGWRVRHWRDRRPEALPSVRVWAQRLHNVPPTDDTHIEALREWTRRVLAAPAAWASNNPLIEVVAD